MKQKSKLKKWIGLFFVVGLVTALLWYSGKEAGAEKKQVVLISKAIDSSNDFWSSMIKGANMAAKEYNVELIVLGPDAETQYEAQGALIESAIAMKPDAIALAPASFTQTPKYAEQIEKAGIELLLVDSVMEEDLGSGLVATDNVSAGEKMGVYIRENYPEGACIGVVGHVQGASTATEREQGLRKGLGELSDRIVNIVFCDSDYRKAYEVTKEMLEEYPDINVIVGLNEYSSVGAAQAVLSMGLEEQIHMIGFDSSIKEVEYLESGVFEAIVVQKPLNMGYLAIENAVKLLQNKEIPDYVDSGSVLITKDTMYTPENQKLLFPL